MSDGLLQDKTVLIVEDQYLIADEMRRAVCSLGGVPVGPFPNVAAARAGCPETVDLALVDINLGAEEVYPLVDELMQTSAAVVFATGYDDSMIPERYEACGRLRKPVSRATLQMALARLLRH